MSISRWSGERRRGWNRSSRQRDAATGEGREPTAEVFVFEPAEVKGASPRR